ncbi:MAG: hypothetical protein WC050_01200 [Candidatus Paceibacterota bacterium]
MIDPVALAQRATLLVEAGVLALNASHAANRRKLWHKKVDVDRLDQRSLTNDVLGQVFGGYWKGMEALNFIREAPFDSSTSYEADAYRGGECGFALGAEYMTWAALNDAWRTKFRLIRMSGKKRGRE